MGLIDGISDGRTRMRELYGDTVRLRVIPMGGGGLLSRFRRLPGMSLDALAGAGESTWSAALPADVDYFEYEDRPFLGLPPVR